MVFICLEHYAMMTHQRQLNGCGATEKVPPMKMKKVWALANLSKLSGE
jgi:hypothetical protein